MKGEAGLEDGLEVLESEADPRRDRLRRVACQVSGGGSVQPWMPFCSVSPARRGEEEGDVTEIGDLLPNKQRQRRTCPTHQGHGVVFAVSSARVGRRPASRDMVCSLFELARRQNWSNPLSAYLGLPEFAQNGQIHLALKIHLAPWSLSGAPAGPPVASARLHYSTQRESH